MENKFEIETEMQNLKALIEVLYTACTGADSLSVETLQGFLNVMSDVVINLDRLIRKE